jgi:transcriptional regulator with XRE-family HTH domain
MPLLRDLIGAVLRRRRLSQGRTLRDVAREAQVSMPYLSELERGRKEASSEVLAAICRALGLSLDELLDEVVVEARRPRPAAEAAQPRLVARAGAGGRDVAAGARRVPTARQRGPLPSIGGEISPTSHRRPDAGPASPTCSLRRPALAGPGRRAVRAWGRPGRRYAARRFAAARLDMARLDMARLDMARLDMARLDAARAVPAMSARA